MSSVTSEDSSYQDVHSDELDSDVEAESQPELGRDIEIKKLYKNKHHKWVDQLPKEQRIQRTVRVASNSNYAVITRHCVEDEELVLDSVVVQNPLLKERLRQVFNDYTELEAAFQSKRLTFASPFREFFYRWHEYEEVLRSEDDELVRQHLELFDSVIRPEIAPHVAEHKDILETGVAKFEDVWTIFEPGAEVYHFCHNHDRVYQFKEVAGTSHPNLRLVCRFIMWNGFDFVWQSEYLTVPHYDGDRAISELEVVPLSMYPQKAALLARLTDRGKKYESLSGQKFRSYTGPWLPCLSTYGVGISQHMNNGRIVIDSTSAPIMAPGTANLDGPPGIDPFSCTGLGPMRVDGSPAPPFLPPLPVAHPSGKKKKKYLARTKKPHPNVMPNVMFDPFDFSGLGLNTPLTLNQRHHLCSPDLRGFCLASKQWGNFSVDYVSDIHFNPATFKRLVLPSDYKDLILAFVGSQMENTETFDDIVEGKGRGITILLRGEPGVGKTLTAEAVAEEMKKPLYTLSAGDLGHDAHAVEANLKNMLDLCALWGAVLLVDECDVFLEKRAATDIDRNKLVAVFLRLLEYYRGCLFLTTNRGGSIDRAFQSRIDLVIQYPNLDTSAKRHIWETFVRPSEDFPHNYSGISDDEISLLARLDLNGRQIKNLVKTARLLARKKGELLRLKHLQTVLRVQEMLPTDSPA